MPIDEVLIELYLKKIRTYINNDCIDMIRDDKSRLTELGISYSEAKFLVKSLTPENYVSGPSQDHLILEQEVYVFGYDYEGIELYIKLTIRIKNDLFIMSFHKAKYELEYPLKKR